MLKKWHNQLACLFEHLKQAHSDACEAEPDVCEQETLPLEKLRMADYRAWKRHRQSLKTALNEVISGFAALQESTSGWEVVMGKDDALARQPEARVDVPDAAERLSFAIRFLQQPQPHKASSIRTHIHCVLHLPMAGDAAACYDDCRCMQHS
jgi:hypothetical protein